MEYRDKDMSNIVSRVLHGTIRFTGKTVGYSTDVVSTTAEKTIIAPARSIGNFISCVSYPFGEKNRIKERLAELRIEAAKMERKVGARLAGKCVDPGNDKQIKEWMSEIASRKSEIDRLVAQLGVGSSNGGHSVLPSVKRDSEKATSSDREKSAARRPQSLVEPADAAGFGPPLPPMDERKRETDQTHVNASEVDAPPSAPPAAAGSPKSVAQTVATQPKETVRSAEEKRLATENEELRHQIERLRESEKRRTEQQDEILRLKSEKKHTDRLLEKLASEKKVLSSELNGVTRKLNASRQELSRQPVAPPKTPAPEKPSPAPDSLPNTNAADVAIADSALGMHDDGEPEASTSAQERGVPEEAGNNIQFASSHERAIFERALEDLQNEDPDVRVDGIQKLQRVENPAVNDVLEKLCDDPAVVVRLNALEQLMTRLDTSALPRFVKAMQDGSASVRMTAIRGLYKLNSKKAIPFLMEALKDRDGMVRRRAVTCLQWLGASEAVPDLISLLLDDEPEVRQAVVHALENLKSKLAVSHLIKVLNDEDVEVRKTTYLALVKLTKKKIVFRAEASEPERLKSVAKFDSWWKMNRGKIRL